MNPDTPFSALALRELKAAAAVTAQPIQAVEARSADQVVTGVEVTTRSGHLLGLWIEDDIPMFCPLAEAVARSAGRDGSTVLLSDRPPTLSTSAATELPLSRACQYDSQG